MTDKTLVGEPDDKRDPLWYLAVFPVDEAAELQSRFHAIVSEYDEDEDPIIVATLFSHDEFTDTLDELRRAQEDGYELSILGVSMCLEYIGEDDIASGEVENDACKVFLAPGYRNDEEDEDDDDDNE